jgi:ribosomal protein S18 acetylase RimI-like enzyme
MLGSAATSHRETMTIEIEEISPERIDEYAAIPIHVDVTERVSPGDPASLRSQLVTLPFRKDYDAIEGAAPSQWAERHELSRWLLLLARDERCVVGAAAVAPASVMSDVALPDGAAVLWDIRVAPHARGTGVGRALLDRAAASSRVRGCRWLIAETQDVNVPACRFYRRMGMTLASFEPRAYPTLPDEARMIWRLELSG